MNTSLVNALLRIIEEEYNTYAEIYCNELDKGMLIFQNDQENFDCINKKTQELIQRMNRFMKTKEELLEQLHSNLSLPKNTQINEIIKKYFPEKEESFLKLRDNFAVLLKATQEVNSKNLMLLNSGASFIKNVFDELFKDKNKMYNNHGDLAKSEYARFHARV